VLKDATNDLRVHCVIFSITILPNDLRVHCVIFSITILIAARELNRRDSTLLQNDLWLYNSRAARCTHENELLRIATILFTPKHTACMQDTITQSYHRKLVTSQTFHLLYYITSSWTFCEQRYSVITSTEGWIHVAVAEKKKPPETLENKLQ
jgi:hypothetical protein